MNKKQELVNAVGAVAEMAWIFFTWLQEMQALI